MSQSGRLIVITGVSRGLGRALTDEFIRLGHRVAGCAVSHAAVRELAAVFPAPHDFSAVDVADDAQVAAWSERVLKTARPARPAAEQRRLDQSQRAVVGGTAGGLFAGDRREHQRRVPRAAALRAGDGPTRPWRDRQLQFRLGPQHGAEVAPYCATKWAIEGLTRALAEELPPGLAAVPLNPGIIDTEMLRSCFGADAAARIPARNAGPGPRCRSCSIWVPRTMVDLTKYPSFLRKE